jgi:hypothetical protein
VKKRFSDEQILAIWREVKTQGKSQFQLQPKAV